MMTWPMVSAQPKRSARWKNHLEKPPQASRAPETRRAEPPVRTVKATGIKPRKVAGKTHTYFRNLTAISHYNQGLTNCPTGVKPAEVRRTGGRGRARGRGR